MKKYALFFLMTVLSLITLSRAFFTPIEAQETPPVSSVEPLVLKTKHISVSVPEVTATPVSIGAESVMSDADIELIALLTMAEAEGECEEGQRLVIDTVLNRVDNPHSPRIDRCWVKDELVQLVREELENRTDYDVIFFRTERYSDYGVPMFQIEHHYFSSYD